MNTFLAFVDYGSRGIQPLGCDQWTRRAFIEALVEAAHPIVRAWIVEENDIEDITEETIISVECERERIADEEFNEHSRQNRNDNYWDHARKLRGAH